jgi:alpha-1,3-mannosyltransferase
MWTIGSFLYTIGLNVKMTALLPLPAIGMVLLQSIGQSRAITQALIIGQMTVRLS